MQSTILTMSSSWPLALFAVKSVSMHAKYLSKTVELAYQYFVTQNHNLFLPKKANLLYYLLFAFYEIHSLIF